MLTRRLHEQCWATGAAMAILTGSLAFSKFQPIFLKVFHPCWVAHVKRIFTSHSHFRLLQLPCTRVSCPIAIDTSHACRRGREHPVRFLLG